MGLIRKGFAVGTLGAVNWRDGSERTAHNTKLMTKLMAQQLAYTEGTPQYAARLRSEERSAARLAKIAEHKPMSLSRYIATVLMIPIAVVIVLFVLAALLST